MAESPSSEYRLNRVDSRLDVLEADVHLLKRGQERIEENNAAVIEELGQVKVGVQRLNDNFRNVVEQNGALMAAMNQDRIAQGELIQKYSKQQDGIAKNVAKLVTIEGREDKWRYLWRLSILFGLMGVLFTLLASPA